MNKFYTFLLILCGATAALHAETYVYNMVDYNAPSMTTTDGRFALKAAKANGVTPPQAGATDKYGEKDLRYYAGNTLTISNLTNETITEIVFHVSKNGHASLTEIFPTAGEMDAEPARLSPNGYREWEYSWHGEAAEITFTIGEKCKFGYECTENGNTDAGTLFFKKLTITTEPTTAIEHVADDNEIFACNGRIVCPESARIYDILGKDVTTENGNLHGIFVVKTKDSAKKIVVR